MQTATGHLLQIGVQRQAVRNLIAWQEHAVKGQLDVATLGNAQRVGARFRDLRKHLGHFFGRFKIKFLGTIAHTLGVVEGFAGADTQQHIVRGCILAAQVVTVVGCHHRQAEITAKRQELTVRLQLPVDAV